PCRAGLASLAVRHGTALPARRPRRLYVRTPRRPARIQQPHRGASQGRLPVLSTRRARELFRRTHGAAPAHVRPARTARGFQSAKPVRHRADHLTSLASVAIQLTLPTSPPPARTEAP